jgi:hypothetical protein
VIIRSEDGPSTDTGRQSRQETMMTNYVLLFRGGSMAETPEHQAQVMQAWTAWFDALGPALVDAGNPASTTKIIAPDGTVSDDAEGPTGYSIISAGSLEAALELAKGCPVLADGASVHVVETFSVM